MNTQRNIYDKSNSVSPAVCDRKGTWFLGRPPLSARGTGPRRNSGTWFIGRKTGAV
jgi:hypothetical protein